MTSSFIPHARNTSVASRCSISLAGMIQIEKTIPESRGGEMYIILPKRRMVRQLSKMTSLAR